MFAIEEEVITLLKDLLKNEL